MPYTLNKTSWAEGEKVKALHMQHLEAGILNASQGFINLKEEPYNAKGDGVADDTAAINAAIAALPKEGATGANGGTIVCPPGIYRHTGVIELKKLTGVNFLGAGGVGGPAALGVGAGNPATVFLYDGGAATRAWDWRNTVGCGAKGIAALARGGLNGYIWDFEGLSVTETSALNHFLDCTVECSRQTTGEKLIIPANCVNLARCNGFHFDNCVFSNGVYGVAGRVSNAVESVAHHFDACWFLGNQIKHVVNADDAWTFRACVAEGLFNNKGEGPTGVGFLGYTEAGIKSRGVVLNGCWSSSNVAAKRVGIHIEYRGNGLVVEGGELACAETGIYFPEGPIGSVVQGVRFNKLTNGIAITGKSKQSCIAFNTDVEEVTAHMVGTKEFEGCVIQENAAGALKVS